MKFLNEIDGADKLVEDASNRLVSDTEKKKWDDYYRGNWDSIRFTVNGDADIYYPVVLTGLNMNEATMSFLEIYRAYSWTAPGTWNTPTHKGGLNLSIDYSLAGWGGQNYELQLTLSQTYSRMVADVITAQPDTNMIIVWLRGGTALYELRRQSKDVQVTVYDGVQGILPFKNKEGTQYENIYDSKIAVEPWFDFTGIKKLLTTEGRLYIGGGYRNPKNSVEIYHENNKPTKVDVGLGNVDNTSDLNKPISTATQVALSNKVDSSRVLTNVPANAKFTDTVYSHPSTHPASMITGLPTSLPANGGEATSAKYLIGDDTRAINSPPSEYMSGGNRYLGKAGWQTEFKNTSTIGVAAHLSGTYCYLETKNPWSDPSGGYPIQLAYGNGIPCWRVGVSTTSWSAWKKVSDGGNASTVNGFTIGVNVPANAKFTDTVTTINGKTGAIAKADITALGIPAQDTVYTHPSTHSADMITDGTNNKAFTATEKNKLSGIETGANKYTHPTTAGNKHIPTGGSSGQVLKYSSSGTAVWGTDNNTITTINGKTGAITKSDITALGIPSQDTTYSNATTTVSGLMSGADKTKLNGIDSDAVKITVGATQPTSGWWFKEI